MSISFQCFFSFVPVFCPYCRRMTISYRSNAKTLNGPQLVQLHMSNYFSLKYKLITMLRTRKIMWMNYDYAVYVSLSLYTMRWLHAYVMLCNCAARLTLQSWALVFKTDSRATVALPDIHVLLMRSDHLTEFSVSVLQLSNQLPQLLTLLLYHLILKLHQTSLYIDTITTKHILLFRILVWNTHIYWTE